MDGPRAGEDVAFSRQSTGEGSPSPLQQVFPIGDGTPVSCIAVRVFTAWATMEAQRQIQPSFTLLFYSGPQWTGWCNLDEKDLLFLSSPILMLISSLHTLAGTPRREATVTQRAWNQGCSLRGQAASSHGAKPPWVPASDLGLAMRPATPSPRCFIGKNGTFAPHPLPQMLYWKEWHLCPKVLVAQSCPTLCGPMDCSPPVSSPWDSPGKNTGVGCHALLQGIFQTQESNPGLLHCRQILYRLNHQGSPKEAILKMGPNRCTHPHQELLFREVS